MYDPLAMPPALIEAHKELDKAVDVCYRSQAFSNDTARIEYLFELYNNYTNPLNIGTPGKRVRKKTAQYGLGGLVHEPAGPAYSEG